MGFGPLSEGLARLVTQPHVFLAYSQWNGWFCPGFPPAKQFSIRLFTSHEIVAVEQAEHGLVTRGCLKLHAVLLVIGVEQGSQFAGHELAHDVRYHAPDIDIFPRAYFIRWKAGLAGMSQ